MKKGLSFLLFLLIGCPLITYGQAFRDSAKFAQAEELRKSYHYQDAIELYRQIMSDNKDERVSRIMANRILLSETGKKMLLEVYRPMFIGTAIVPVPDFFLYFPGFAKNSWIPVPSILAGRNDSHISLNAIRYSAADNTIIYSSKNPDGNWDLFETSRIDSLNWTYPKYLSSGINTPGDEIFPFVAPGGKQLYFSSNGHKGAGGFDLYVSEWNEKKSQWDSPKNIGFPFSTPANDYLYTISDDKKSIFFASDRDMETSDSVRIYQLENEEWHITGRLDDVYEIQNLAKISTGPVSQHQGMEGINGLQTTHEAEEYSTMAREARAVQKQIDKLVKEMRTKREETEGVKITQLEDELLSLQEKLERARKIIEEREKDIWERGIIIPREHEFLGMGEDTLMRSKVLDQSILFSAKNTLGYPVPLYIIESAKIIDERFSIGERTVIISNNTFNVGLTYTIKLFTQPRKALPSSFQGIDPVIENVNHKGQYEYFAGLFYSYEEMNKALKKVKELGFDSATGIAFFEGKPISLRIALEKQRNRSR